jgi:hypothetical protein
MQLPLLSAQPQLPDLTGQPPWVVVVVTVLMVAGWVGARWLTRERDPDGELDADSDEARPLAAEGVASPAAVPVDHHATAVIMRALELLHHEAEESRDGREEADRWRELAEDLRRQLNECRDQLDQRPERREP